MLDMLSRRVGAQNDGGLARKLRVSRHVITMVREGKISVSASMMLWFHEASGLSFEELRGLLGDRRARYRVAGR